MGEGESVSSKNSAAPILCVVGARPNFMKIAPIMSALHAGPRPVPARLLHTGQHYDAAMKDAFFTQLGIPEPDIDLDVGSATHAVQTADIMKRFEPVLDAERPAAVLVVGDVNSTIACALVAAKKGVPVIHVEAGLRSYDRTMPEEINRVLTDQMSDLLFTTERQAHKNLAREGIDPRRIHFVGNVMIDTLLGNLPRAIAPERSFAVASEPEIFARSSTGYALVTLHRPSNVDATDVLERLIGSLRRVSESIPVVFPVHPRTRARIEAAGLTEALRSPHILELAPLGYLEMLGLMAKARIVLTDSGGIQEETTALGIPCLTLRENTERPITVEQGTNTIVGSDPKRIETAMAELLAGGGKAGRIPELWDGKAAHRIKAVILDWLNAAQPGIARVAER
jgi:UDP-N-acetylglucosamine 2-epimerase (non-hydrolysing)